MQTLKSLIAEKGAIVGTICTLGSIEAIEIAASSGFDFMFIDGEHGCYDLATLREAARAMEAMGAFPIVRIPANGASWIESLLDAGFPAMIAPMVNSVEQATTLVGQALYPPLGTRSQASCRATIRWGSGYRKSFNDDFALITMIEHIDGVNAVDEILAVPGISGVFVGPTDLGSSIDGDATKLAEAIEHVRVRALAAGKILGIAASSPAAAVKYRDQGFQFITIVTDRRLLAGACSATTSEWRGETK
ncbi:MAG TPA: aldolase/citrate lyase family protein [Capsulimonadaceae bacterium]|jgi:4-hydroxy-2-oxoheptanedioate aldolase